MSHFKGESNKDRAVFYHRLFILTLVLLAFLCSPFFSDPVSANPRYGIQEEKAPPLTAQAWVDSTGNPSPSFTLKDQKGKIVYLLFFQDW